MVAGTVLFAGLILALATTGCSTKQTGDGASIAKVRYYHLQGGRQTTAGDAMLAFEPRYRQHGALTSEERRELEGHYYTVWWKVRDRSQPVTVRMEYRQEDDALNVRTLEQVVGAPGRSNQTLFEVTGEPYHAGGPVVAHRVTVIQGEQELVEWKSYLWE